MIKFQTLNYIIEALPYVFVCNLNVEKLSEHVKGTKRERKRKKIEKSVIFGGPKAKFG